MVFRPLLFVSCYLLVFLVYTARIIIVLTMVDSQFSSNGYLFLTIIFLTISKTTTTITTKRTRTATELRTKGQSRLISLQTSIHSLRTVLHGQLLLFYKQRKKLQEEVIYNT